MPTAFEKYPELYGSPRWRRLRLAVHDRDNYLCQECHRMGRETMTTVSSPVHHIHEHHGDRRLFFDMDNLESVCFDCHKSLLQMRERHGYSQACDANGYPLDPNHPFFNNRSEDAGA